MLLALNDCWLQWKKWKTYNLKTFGLCRDSIHIMFIKSKYNDKYVSGFHHDCARKEGSKWFSGCIINWIKKKQHGDNLNNAPTNENSITVVSAMG